ncbi:hypothetical protein BTH_I2710 [Burkholderia thailandensis E264]|uniref:Uncharacterized protein n=1 Tax=Burkholderia thailandensis (strain ATCC 700388 / DSM 13276 / CCUG 48851 / CIP 106301 / E264) TaxID=271848 RepID=Q2SV24_BURTA|nr:hypothetical protein BTH_I2710 [Burkholderia thailandensis E264]
MRDADASIRHDDLRGGRVDLKLIDSACADIEQQAIQGFDRGMIGRRLFVGGMPDLVHCGLMSLEQEFQGFRSGHENTIHGESPRVCL